MAGHSKWKKIKRKKGVQDVKRGKIFTRLIREITVAARKGGGDPDFNPVLRMAMVAARQSNMPLDNVEKAIKRGTGELEGISYEEVSYEGYGPGGVAVIVDVITDNKTRTVSEVRSFFSKQSGSLAAAGSVSWMFEKKGTLRVNKKTISEEALFEISIEAGAEDIKDEGDFFEIDTSFEAFERVRKALDDKKVEVEVAELTMIPKSTVHLDGQQAEQMIKLMEMLEDNDDVQKIHANFDIDDKELEKLSA